MYRSITLQFLSALALVASAVPASAVTVPFTEDFSSNDANWKTAANAAPVYTTTGGPGGVGDAYISNVFTEPAGASAVTIFRGQDNFNASGGAFIGDWVAAGVTQFSFYIRQNSTEPLTIGARFATSLNSPGFSYLTEPARISPNQWYKINIAIDPGNAGLQPEGGSFSDVFANLARIQIIAQRGSLTAGTQVTFDIDKVSVVPEPGTLSLAVLGVLGLAAFWRIRRRR